MNVLPRLCLYCVAIFIVLMGVKAEAASPYLAPHKAVYDVKLLSAKNGSQMVNIRGTMVFSWKPSCDGWITTHEFKLRHDYADMSPSNIASRYTMFESFDGKTLQFNSRQTDNGKIIEEIKGKASPSQAVFTAPLIKTLKLPQGVIFPTNHAQDLMRAAKAGKPLHNSIVFDGSDTEGSVERNTLIQKMPDKQITLIPSKTPIPKAIAQDLLEGKVYKLRMAFFNENQTDLNADYEMSLLLHENGIISDMIVDYKDFSLSQKLVSLTPIPQDQCGRTKKP